MRRRWIAVFTVAAIALVTLAAATPSEADKQGPIPGYAVRLAGGSLKSKGRWGYGCSVEGLEDAGEQNRGKGAFR